MNSISANEVKDRLEAGETLFLVDVREDYEVQHGKIPEAIHIPMGEIPSKLDVFNREMEYIFICKAGVRSENVCEYLTELGYKAINMEGGMMAWEGELD
ncbi:rhodanese-like domain-containing protein [Gottfriedia solisilvae]|uniref:Rhodanese-like domain-containing protein n=1 Tax=Gottfriedia solisilvae TaxID=1516104 RepID=A0A8J3EVV7_9BACI|nr:rhodanese-like domain-containing protein [Gottfriedia solisilvae]GGI09987.1 rhodanese-like domain-containing protein [Gottfriedia solisilvae]